MSMHGYQDVCSTAIRRQNTQLLVDRKLTIVPKTPRRRRKERAPIVELLPFRRKVWKREKSFAYNAHVDTVKDAPRITDEVDVETEPAYVEPRIQTLTPRVSDHIVPSRQKGSSTKKIGPSSSVSSLSETPRIPRSSTELSFPSFPDGFVTIGTRQRSTLEEIHERDRKPSDTSKEKDTASYDSIKDAIDQESSNATNKVKDNDNVLREKKERNLSPRRLTGHADSITEASITVDGASIQEWRIPPDIQFPEYQHYNFSRPYLSEDNYTIDSVSKVRPSTDNRHLTTPHEKYTFDRAMTLPSINIRNAPLKTRQKRNETSRKDVSKSDSTWSYHVRHEVPNTLQYMESKGRPMGLEKQLSMDLSITLDNIRRNKSYNGTTQMPFILGSPQRGYLRAHGPPTRGEKRIEDARKPNHSQQAGVIKIPLINPRHAPPIRLQYTEKQNIFKIPKSESKDSGIDSIEHHYNPRQLDKTIDHFKM
ncbi:unnamed protein product [Owenia fusiformis]|uniref:Uncharacterized protein n=1 Tax=Owenia fusiformis TaxID=6347 RepID=A0A8J1T9X5_OWEFU|nr:unnamed protein product [Owenia fusiformis]